MEVVVVLGKDFEIDFSKTSKELGYYGDFDYIDRKIFVASDLDKSGRDSALLRVVLEIIDFVLDLGLTQPQLSALETALSPMLEVDYEGPLFL